MQNSILIILIFFLCSANLFGQETVNSVPGTSTYTSDKPYQTIKVKPVNGKKIRNVILMIGDGMGLSQISAAWVANHGKLNIDNCTSTGFSRTWCANKLITDSGAAGTAMATGTKTNYHSIAVDPQGKPLVSLADVAHANGLTSGIVVTCNLPDATPAVFCAHNIDRDKEEEVAADYLNCKVDYIFGAGREEFNKRADKRDLLAEMKQKGYQVCTTWDETSQIKSGKVFSVIKEGQLDFARDRGDIFDRACQHAIRLLNQNKKGFFAMLEGSRIDDCGHFNDLPHLIEEVFDFDRSIGSVIQWAEKDAQTLVIVLADHETGGLTLLDGDLKTGTVTCNYSTKGHSGIMVPVYAYGPGAENFRGIYENTEIFHKIVKLLNIKE